VLSVTFFNSARSNALTPSTSAVFSVIVLTSVGLLGCPVSTKTLFASKFLLMFLIDIPA
jgi:hypothetical protein